MSSRDLRRLFSALRQHTTEIGHPDHIALPVIPKSKIGWGSLFTSPYWPSLHDGIIK